MTSSNEGGDVQRIITIWKMLQEVQRNAELASGALVSSAAISRLTGRSVIAQIPINAQRTKRTGPLFGRTLYKTISPIDNARVLETHQPKSMKAKERKV